MTRQPSIILIILGIAALVISACSAGGGGEGSGTSSNNTSAIAGFWESNGSLGVEDGWFSIDKSGILTSYAQSSEFGNTCFVVESGTESLTRLEGNNYFYNSTVTQYFAELFITAEGNLFQRKEGESTGMVAGIKPPITMSQMEEWIKETGYCSQLVNIDNANELPPAIPGNLQAIASSQQIILTWDAVTSAESFVIFWDTTPVPGKYKEAITTSNMIEIANSKNTYVHTALTPNQSYHYRIASFNNRGETKGLSTETSGLVLP